MAKQMNNAFEGKKESISSKKTKADHSLKDKMQNLEPILEETTG
jgi:hypothetical protein